MIQIKVFEKVDEKEINDFLNEFGDRIAERGRLTFENKVVFYYFTEKPDPKQRFYDIIDNIQDSFALKRIQLESDYSEAVQNDLNSSGKSDDERKNNLLLKQDIEKQIKTVDRAIKKNEEIRGDIKEGKFLSELIHE